MEKDIVNPIGKKWEFDKEVTSVFGDMISRSIPNYDAMRELCFRVGHNFVHDGDKVSDIGCSNGLASEKFIENFPNTTFILNDVSEPMLEACREKYNGNKNVKVVYHDLRKGVFEKGNSLVISCLTLQFTPIEYRQDILQSVYDSLCTGGHFFLLKRYLVIVAR